MSRGERRVGPSSSSGGAGAWWGLEEISRCGSEGSTLGIVPRERRPGADIVFFFVFFLFFTYCVVWLERVGMGWLGGGGIID